MPKSSAGIGPPSAAYIKASTNARNSNYFSSAGANSMPCSGATYRRRALFLLPLLVEEELTSCMRASAGACKRAGRRRRILLEANEVITVLNEFLVSLEQPGLATAAQRKARALILDQFSKAPPPERVYSGREAVCELLANSYACSEELSTTVRPYDAELVSMPTIGTSVLSIAEVLDRIGSDVVGDFERVMLLESEDYSRLIESNEHIQSHMDIVFRTQPRKYYVFIKDLYDKNMVDFTDEVLDLCTPFFVIK
jgi:hypothetical protein